jgi:hypothetical protein
LHPPSILNGFSHPILIDIRGTVVVTGIDDFDMKIAFFSRVKELVIDFLIFSAKNRVQIITIELVMLFALLSIIVF